MRDALIVLNPRRISECLSAIDELPIDKLWIRNMSEPQIVSVWPSVLRELRGYSWAWIISDDACPRPFALEAVRDLAAQGHPVVTGYSNLDRGSPLVNLVRSPLGPTSVPESFDLYSLADIQESEAADIPTWFCGFSLTGMSVAMWTHYPYQLESEGWSADFNLSKRFERDGVPIVAHRDAFVWHVKEQWCRPDESPRKRLYVGVNPEIVLEEMVAA